MIKDFPKWILFICRKMLVCEDPEQLLMFSSFYEDGVVWPNGEREPVDAIVYATGFRPHLPYLKILGALDGEGNPIQKAGISRIPGLFFVGLEG